MPSKLSKKSGWKVVQSKKRVQEKTKLAFLILGLIVLVLVFSQAFRFTRTLFSSWKISNIQRNYTWDGKLNINFLIRSKNLALVSYNPTDKKITIINIPDRIYLESAGGFGSWLLSSLYDLGENQKNLGGDKLLRDTLVRFFAQPIDGVLDFSGEMKKKTALGIVTSIRGNLIPISLLSNLKTNLTIIELLRLKLGLSSVRFDKVSEVNLEDSLTNDRLLDGTEVLVADPNKLDLALVDFIDPKIKNEHKTVVIFNGTDKALFAQDWARLVANIGGSVIFTTNAQKQIDKTLVVGEASLTRARLSEVFNSSCKESDCDKIQKSDEDFSSSRGQINIKLAPDLVN